MALMLICGLLLLAGLVLVVVWSGLAVVPPVSAPGSEGLATALRHYCWWATLVVTTGLVTGVLIAGAGGRLIMRLLASTSPEARGLLTEAGETVGRISISGTLGFLVFAALPLAMLAALAFAGVHRWLPDGRLAGLLFGMLLLLAASTRVEPLRPANPDFRLLGPAWLALLTFGLLVVAEGMATAAFMGWYSRRLSLPQRDLLVLGRFALTGAALVLTGPIGVLVLGLALTGAAAVTLAALVAPGLSRRWMSRRTTAVGRALLAVVALLALPGFVTAVNDILT